MIEGERLRRLQAWVVNTTDEFRLGSGNSEHIKKIRYGRDFKVTGINRDTLLLAEEDIVYVNERLMGGEDG